MACYLVAKKFNKDGCYALRTEHGKHLVELKKKLNEFAVPNDIQIITLSRPSAYGEYEPYNFVYSEEELVERVQSMCIKTAVIKKLDAF